MVFRPTIAPYLTALQVGPAVAVAAAMAELPVLVVQELLDKVLRAGTELLAHCLLAAAAEQARLAAREIHPVNQEMAARAQHPQLLDHR